MTPDTPFTGFVCGLKSEARCLRPLSKPSAGHDPAAVKVAVSGASAERARDISKVFGLSGATGLISFGLSGGLMDRLKPGDLVLAGSVAEASGAVFPTDPTWSKSLATHAKSCGLTLHPAPLYGSATVISTRKEKQSIYQKTGAWAVDMESHAVAESAAALGLPFIALRAIADPADRIIPPSAALAVAPDGGIRPLPVLAGLARRPGDFGPLLHLKQDSQAALDALSCCVCKLLGGLLRPL